MIQWKTYLYCTCKTWTKFSILKAQFFHCQTICAICLALKCVMSQNGLTHFVKSLHQILQDFWSAPDHFQTLCIKKVNKINPNLGGLFRGLVCFEVGGGGCKITPYLKLVRIMLETSNLACKYTDICSFRKYTFYYQDLLNFANVSIFL